MSHRNIFIINPKAGKHNSTEFITASATKSLVGIPYELITTEYAGHATELVKELCDSGDDCRIYSCGGDGTLSEVVNGVYRGGFPENVAVGCIPVGSGNDFIKYFESIPSDTFLDISRQAAGSTKKIDLLEVGNRVTVNTVTAGYDSAVCRYLGRFKSLPLISGSTAYNMSAAYCLISHMKNRYTFYVDGKMVDSTDSTYLLAVAANGRYYGGGYKAAPYAVADDGYIDFLRIPKISRLTFARFVGIFRRGEHLDKLNICKLERCKKVKITANEPIDVNIDGEIFKMNDPEINIIPRCLNFILPIKEEKA